MRIDRRVFLGTGLAAALLPGRARAARLLDPIPGTWRSFEVTTQLVVANPSGAPQAWLPLPAVEAAWIRTLGNTWRTNAETAQVERDPHYGAEMLHVQWAEGTPAPMVEVTSRVSTQDRAVDLSNPAGAPALPDDQRKLFTAPTTLIPTDGIVRETALKATKGMKSDLAQARGIYEWVVENTFRDPKTRGCGLGDIATMLESGTLGGKCADLNALYVGMARAVGLPARDVYGLRIAPSRFGYKSLGTSSPTVTKAQHCRAEVYLSGYGWVPVDPADVRKVALEEPPGNRPLTDGMVAAAREALFGAWEMNWLAWNTAHDVRLPGAKDPTVEFLMYPQVETAKGRLDCLDPDSVRYTITSKELEPA